MLLSTVMRLGVVGLAKTLARSLAPDNIRVNLVAPGYFDSGRVHAARPRADDARRVCRSEDAEAEISGGLPVGRIGSPDELAELVAFVASRKAGFMTGSTISIDGGGKPCAVLIACSYRMRTQSCARPLRLYAADLHYPKELQVHTAASGLVASLSARYLAIERSDGFRGIGEVRANITYLSHLPEIAVDPAIIGLCRPPAMECRRPKRFSRRSEKMSADTPHVATAAVENALVEGMARGRRHAGRAMARRRMA